MYDQVNLWHNIHICPPICPKIKKKITKTKNDSSVQCFPLCRTTLYKCECEDEIAYSKAMKILDWKHLLREFYNSLLLFSRFLPLFLWKSSLLKTSSLISSVPWGELMAEYSIVRLFVHELNPLPNLKQMCTIIFYFKGGYFHSCFSLFSLSEEVTKTAHAHT